jgi:hypothetical protein
MGAMDYTKRMHCNRPESPGNSTINTTKQYTVCWSGDETGLTPVADRTVSINFNNNYVYGLVSFFLGIILLCCNIYVEPYSFGWWMLTVKGTGLIVLCFVILCVELLNIE